MPPLILDTHVVLDWLLFDDARVASLALAVTSGRIRWVVTAAMRSELEHVLHRGIASRPGHAIGAIVREFDRWADAAVSVSRFVPPALRCSDPDDQIFIDLGLQLGQATLLSRDRAVLRLARAAAPYGLRITTPERWTDPTRE